GVRPGAAPSLDPRVRHQSNAGRAARGFPPRVRVTGRVGAGGLPILRGAGRPARGGRPPGRPDRHPRAVSLIATRPECTTPGHLALVAARGQSSTYRGREIRADAVRPAGPEPRGPAGHRCSRIQRRAEASGARPTLLPADMEDEL